MLLAHREYGGVKDGDRNESWGHQTKCWCPSRIQNDASESFVELYRRLARSRSRQLDGVRLSSAGGALSR